MSNAKNNNADINSLFSSGDDLPPMQPETPSQNESHGDAISLESHLMVETSPSGGGMDFSESNAMFDEIRSFGEGASPAPETGGLNMPDPSMDFSELAAPTPAPKAPAAAPRRQTTVNVGMGSENFPITLSDSLAGHTIEQHLGLVSAWAPLDANQADPLAPLVQQLIQNATAKGANAIVAVRIQSLSGDNSGLLVVGTAVVSSGG